MKVFYVLLYLCVTSPRQILTHIAVRRSAFARKSKSKEKLTIFFDGLFETSQPNHFAVHSFRWRRRTRFVERQGPFTKEV